MIVDGVLEEFDLEEEEAGEAPDEDVELDGTWTFEYAESSAGSTKMTLAMSDAGAVSGQVTLQSRFMDQPQTVDVRGRLSGKALSLDADLDIEGFSVEIEYEGEVSGDTFEGTATWTFSGGSQDRSFTAKRAPEARQEVQR
mgnify:FL=1